MGVWVGEVVLAARGYGARRGCKAEAVEREENEQVLTQSSARGCLVEYWVKHESSARGRLVEHQMTGFALNSCCQSSVVSRRSQIFSAYMLEPHLTS